MEKDCGIRKSLDLLGAKWTMPVLWALCSDPKGFNQIEREIGDISPRVLSERLKDLVEGGLVHKEIFPTTPPTVQYSLTKKGLSLKPIIESLDQWGRV